MLSSYRHLLALPQARALAVCAAVARLGAAMLGIALLWHVHGTTGSFAEAGLVGGAFAAGEALLAPQVARVVDGLGQRRVLRVQLPALAVAGVAVAVLPAVDAPLAAPVAAGLVLGVACPQIGALAAARWRLITSGTGRLSTALAFEASVTQIAFLVSAVVVGTTAVAIHPSSGLALALVLLLAGSTGLAACRGSEPAPAGRVSRGLGDRRLLRPAMLGLAAFHAVLGCWFGSVPVLLLAATTDQGVAAWTGVISAVGGVLSLGVGLAYGGGDRPRSVTRWMVAGSAAMALGALTAATTDHPAGTAVGFALGGAAIAALVVPAAALLVRAVPVEVYGQANTWTGSASALGVAVAGPIAGAGVDHVGWPPTLAALALVPVGLGGLALLLRGTARR